MEDKEIKELDKLDYLSETLEWVMQRPYHLNVSLVETIKNNLHNISLEKVKMLREMVMQEAVRPVEESQLANIEGLPPAQPTPAPYRREVILKNEKKQFETVQFFDSNSWFQGGHGSVSRR